MKKVIYLLILIVSLFTINNLVRSIINLSTKQDVVSRAQLELQKVKNENKKLKDQLSEAQRNEFVEREARDKLFMAKPGEKIVILGSEKDEDGQLPSQPTLTPIPNWKQWLRLFFQAN